MTDDFKKYVAHYIFLIAILMLGFGSFILVSFDRSLQLKISMLIAGSYFSWGVIHHFLKDDLHPRVMVEYLLFSLMTFLVLFFIVVRA